MTKEITVREQHKEQIIERLKKTPIIQLVCERVGVARSTFYRWRNKDKKFAKAVDTSLINGRQIINEMAESQLISGIKDKNMTAIIFWLKHNSKRYSTKVELNGRLNTETKLSPEQEKMIKRALQLASISDDKPADSSE